MDAGLSPLALRKGDIIAVVSPSARLNDLFPGRIARGKAALEQLGYRVKVIFNTPVPKSLKDEVAHRCEELHSAFRDPSIRAIVCAIGGLSANELLRHLDYELIKANPKIFLGYSDITLLHYALYTQANLHTFYGPAIITQFGEFPEPLAFTTKHFLHVLTDPTHAVGALPRSSQWTQEFVDWLTEADTQRPRKLTANEGWRWLRRGMAEGRLFGGCLQSVLQLRGTRYEPDYHGRILLLETPEFDKPDVGTPLDLVRAQLGDLANAGVLHDIAGLVLGRPFQYDEAMRRQFEQLVLDVCYDTSFPILANVDLGHTDPMLTIPLNALARLDSTANEFAVLEPAVR